MGHNIITVENLTRRFGALVAVDHLDFSVREGEFFGFLGPNGAGKTTAVRMLTGVITPTEGTAFIEGHDIRTEGLLSRAHLGVVPEQANVYPDLTVWRNIILMGELFGVPRRQLNEDAAALVHALGLDKRKKQKAQTLSKGLRQRVMLCAALVTRPAILFLDEPTSGLDVQSARLIRDIVRKRNENGLTVFLTTHNMNEAEQMCSRIAIMNNGSFAAIDSPDGLRQTIQANQYVEVGFEHETPEEKELSALPSVSEATKVEGLWRLYAQSPGQAATEVLRLVDSKGMALSYISTQKPNLEDIFLYLTAAEDSIDAAA